MTSRARRVITPLFNTATIWSMWALIPNPSTMKQTTCRAMSEPNFWNGTRSKNTFFFRNKEELLAYCTVDVNVMRQAYRVFEICF